MMHVIDCNTHFGTHPDRAADLSLPTLVASLDRHHIARAWTYSLRGVSHLADDANRETLAATRAHPSLVPVATIDPKRYLGQQEEIARCLGDGMRIMRFFPREQDWKIDSRPMGTILDRLRGSGAVLVFSAVGWGSATEVARATADHGLPVVLVDVHYTQMAECLDVMQRFPHIWAATNRIGTQGGIETCVREVGAARLLFGSETPERPPQCALNQIWFADISDEDRAAIFGGNAMRLMAGAAAGSSPAAGPRAEPPPRSVTPIIDVHAHVGRFPFPLADDGGVAAMARHRQTHNIDRIIASSSDAIAYDLVEGNRRMQEIIDPHPWLLGYVTINANYLDESAAQMDHYYRFGNFVGAKIHGSYANTATSAPAMRALFREIARRGKPVKIHNSGMDWDAAIVRLAREFPELAIIIAHAGLGSPSADAIDAAASAENIFLEFCTTSPSRGIIRAAIERAGIEKILYGSDQLLIDPGYVLGAYQDAAPTPLEWEQIAWHNPRRVFKMA